MWEDAQPAESGGMVDGCYKYVACHDEDFLRAAAVDDHMTLSAGATVLMAGTLEVRGRALDLWTNSSDTFRPLSDLAMQARLPVENWVN